MNMVTVRINGVDYNLKGEENEEYLKKVVNYVDKKIDNLIENNDKLSTASAAVFTAISAVDDYFKCREICDSLETKVKKEEREKREDQGSIDSLKLQIKQLEKRNNDLSEQLKNSKELKIIAEKDEEISNLNTQIDILSNSSKSVLKSKNELILENKELRFQLQTSKYKIMELQNKFLENQIDLAKAKSNISPPYLKNKK
ncbi:MAG: cell division protein ZapA [Bacillota bacterium]|nr:cell division protein ZapA [Bacillota bacterium]